MPLWPDGICTLTTRGTDWQSVDSVNSPQMLDWWPLLPETRMQDGPCPQISRANLVCRVIVCGSPENKLTGMKACIVHMPALQVS